MLGSVHPISALATIDDLDSTYTALSISTYLSMTALPMARIGFTAFAVKSGRLGL